MQAAVLSAVAVSISFFLHGWDFAMMSGADYYIRTEFDLDSVPTIDGAIVIMPTLGAIIVTIFFGPLSDWLGRRITFILSTIPFLLGGLLMLWSPNIFTLLLSRLVIGLGFGLAFNLVPIYISETSLSETRGSLNTIPQLMFCTGMFLSYCMVFVMMLMPNPQPRVMMGALAVPSTMYLILMVFYLRESPIWLIFKGQISEATNVLQWLRGRQEVLGELALMIDHSNTHVHESFDSGSMLSFLFPDLGSFGLSEQEALNNEQLPDDSISIDQFYEIQGGATVEGLRAPFLSHAASSSVVSRDNTRLWHELVTSLNIGDQLRSVSVGGFQAPRSGQSIVEDDRAEDSIALPGQAESSIASSSRGYVTGAEYTRGASLVNQPIIFNGQLMRRHQSGRGLPLLVETAAGRPKYGILLTYGVRRALFIGIIIQLLCQFTGASGILRYAPQIYERAGVVNLFSETGLSSHLSSILVSSLVSFLTLPFAAVAIKLMDISGRRRLLLVTTPFLILSLVTLSLPDFVEISTTAREIVILTGIISSLCAYTMGLGPIPSMLCSEFFPTSARAMAVSICSLAFWLGGLLSTYCLSAMMSMIGLQWALLVYAFPSCIFLIFALFWVPETKRLPLGVIAENFNVRR